MLEDLARGIGELQEDMRKGFAEQARRARKLEEHLWERLTAMQEQTNRLLAAEFCEVLRMT